MNAGWNIKEAVSVGGAFKNMKEIVIKPKVNSHYHASNKINGQKRHNIKSVGHSSGFHQDIKIA